MSDDFNLSDKIGTDVYDRKIIGKEDVKEFIKQLKERFSKCGFYEWSKSEIIEKIDRLAGDDLK